MNEDHNPNYCKICEFTWDSHEYRYYLSHKKREQLKQVPENGVWLLVDWNDGYRWLQLGQFDETHEIMAVSKDGEIIAEI